VIVEIKFCCSSSRFVGGGDGTNTHTYTQNTIFHVAFNMDLFDVGCVENGSFFCKMKNRRKSYMRGFCTGDSLGGNFAKNDREISKKWILIGERERVVCTYSIDQKKSKRGS
jgi:hypothetical protein